MLWQNIIISKIESKSQLNSFDSIGTLCCGKYHYFKDRKQITTLTQKKPSPIPVVAKYHYFKDRKQITTAIWLTLSKVVANIVFPKTKANHNGSVTFNCKACVVANIIISKIESKSQHRPWQGLAFVFGKYHYFKDRKQITTNSKVLLMAAMLWQISLFQRSKANHNYLGVRLILFSCGKISLFQRSKANHNYSFSGCHGPGLWQISLFQRSKANHN